MPGIDNDDLEALESDVLDALAAADDADAAPGTVALSAARRRRATADGVWLLGAS